MKKSNVIILSLCLLVAGSYLTWIGISNAAQREVQRGVVRWNPADLGVGMSSAPGEAAFVNGLGGDYRYQYLSGGAGRSGAWPTWNQNGNFPRFYIEDSLDNGVTPIFTYYMICQATDACYSNEPSAISDHLANTSIMTSYWNELALFFEKAAEFGDEPVILHMEPDLWGFLHQASANDDVGNYGKFVAVRSTGISEINDLPDTPAGFAQAIFALRDAKGADNVIIAYHLSAWGVRDDFVFSNPSTSEMIAQADRGIAFYQSFEQEFDLIFSETSDRDAGYYQSIGFNDPYWSAQDYANHVTLLSRFHDVTGKDLMIWQIPFGNTLYKAMNNTQYHWQDNAVETFLGEPDYATLNEYRRAGVVALLFGQGAGGGITTCICDDAGDGVTNPSPINGNNLDSLSSDDDGGYFKQTLADYVASGKLPIGFRVIQEAAVNQIKLSWNDIGADQYEVWRSNFAVIDYNGDCASSISCDVVTGTSYERALDAGLDRQYFIVLPVTNGVKADPSTLFTVQRLEPGAFFPMLFE